MQAGNYHATPENDEKLPITCYSLVFCHGVMLHAKFILTDKVSCLKNNWGRDTIK